VADVAQGKVLRRTGDSFYVHVSQQTTPTLLQETSAKLFEQEGLADAPLSPESQALWFPSHHLGLEKIQNGQFGMAIGEKVPLIRWVEIVEHELTFSGYR
jgi:hypothetical protein